MASCDQEVLLTRLGYLDSSYNCPLPVPNPIPISRHLVRVQDRPNRAPGDPERVVGNSLRGEHGRERGLDSGTTGVACTVYKKT